MASGQPEDIDRWRDLSSGQYPIYTAQDTSIKELVRGNPGLVSIRNGRIAWKTSLSAIDMADEAEVVAGNGPADEITTFPFGTEISGPQILESLSIILAAFLFCLAALSHFPRIRR